MRALFLFLATLGSSTAFAADCPVAYTTDALLGDLVATEEFLRNGDDGAAGTAAKKLETGLGCMGEVLPPMIAGRALRAVGAGLVASGESARGGQWFRTATEIEQAFEYGIEDLPEGHPVRDAYAQAKAVSGDLVGIDGKAFVPVGTHYLDGRKISGPSARLDRLHVYQLEGSGVKTWVIEGNTFPDEVLEASAPVVVAAPEPAKAPKIKEPKPPKPVKEAKVAEPKPEKPEKVAVADVESSGKAPKAGKTQSSASGTVVLQRQRPWEKTPLLVGGGVVVAAGGGLYALALGARGSFEEAGNEADVRKFAKQANQLVLASAAVLAVGTGTLTWGVILDGGSPMPALRVRF